MAGYDWQHERAVYGGRLQLSGSLPKFKRVEFVRGPGGEKGERWALGLNEMFWFVRHMGDVVRLQNCTLVLNYTDRN